MIAGLLGSLALVPDTLRQLVAIEDVPTDQGGHSLRLAIKQSVAGTKVAGSVLVSFQDDGRTPAQFVVRLPGSPSRQISAKITVRGWQVNAAANQAMFAPPAGLPIHEVEQADLYHVFSAIFDFAVEKTE